MYTVLLVDDEKPILDSLMSEISWAELGVNKVLTASDGLIALQLMELEKVDLLITDIRMPQMDGLELLSRVQALYPQTHSILLTAYGEFDYARQALSFGVENYLLKPLQKEEMEQTIEKALDNLYSNKNKNNNNKLFLKNILSRWVNGNISPEELGERSRLLNINVYLNKYCVICIRKQVRTANMSAFFHRCEQQLDDKDTYSFWDDNGRFVIIIGGNIPAMEKLTGIFYDALLLPDHNGRFLVSIGSLVDNSEDLWQSYQKACDLLETHTTVTSFGVITPLSENHFSDDAQVHELEKLFQENDEQIRRRNYHNFANSLLSDSADSVAYNSLIHILIRFFTHNFPSRSGIQKELSTRMRLYLATTNDPLSLFTELLEFSYLLYRYFIEQLSPVIQQALSYIHNHYQEPISVKDLCTRNKMNTAYLGYLFKNETGTYFNNYLQQYRISAALTLLQDGDMLLNDIAAAVGFASTTYFISCFKKQIGVSPNKYRSQRPTD